MSGYVWDLSGTDAHCASYAPGHLIHWIHFNHSMSEPSAVVPVTADVGDDGLVHVEGDDGSLVRWNHRPALLRDALQRFDGRADWKPRWRILAVPTESFMGGARSVFHLAALDQRRECYVPGSANREPAAPGVNAPAGRHLEKVWAEQEAKNAELREIDYSHIPPLRIADWYAGGRAQGRSRIGSSGTRRAKRQQ